jgi:hypothetical protein
VGPCDHAMACLTFINFSQVLAYVQVRYLTKYLTMKIYPVLNQAPRHADGLGSNFGTRLRRVVSLTPRPLYSGTLWIGSRVGPRASLVTVMKRKTCPCRESNPDRPSCSIVTILTELSRIQCITCMCIIPGQIYIYYKKHFFYKNC